MLQKSEKEIFRDFRAQMILARKDKNYTQAYLAELSDASTKYISNIESGSANPSLKYIIKICRALDIELNFNYLG